MLQQHYFSFSPQKQNKIQHQNSEYEPELIKRTLKWHKLLIYICSGVEQERQAMRSHLPRIGYQMRASLSSRWPEVKVSRNAPERRTGKKYTDLVYRNAPERLGSTFTHVCTHSPVCIFTYFGCERSYWRTEFRAILLFLFSAADLFLAFPQSRYYQAQIDR